MEAVADFTSLGSNFTADSVCSHNVKRCLPLERKAMTNLDSILKSRQAANIGLYSQSYDFFSSHYGCESWTIKKAES